MSMSQLPDDNDLYERLNFGELLLMTICAFIVFPVIDLVDRIKAKRKKA